MYERTYHAKVLAQHTPPEKKRRKRFPWRRVIAGGVAVVVLVGIVLLIRLPGLQVQMVTVEGTRVVDPEEVTQVVWSKLDGTYLSLFPRRSMFVAPTKRIEKAIRASFSRFSDVRVDRKGLHELTVSVVEYEGTYLWCEDEATCYFMTKDGVVFAPAPFFSGDAYIKIFIGEKGEFPFEPLSQKMITTLELLLERLPLLGIEPLALYERSLHQLDVVFSHHGENATLMLDHTRNTQAVLEDLATGLATEPLKARFRDSAHVLEYLDARFANKVVYKFK